MQRVIRVPLIALPLLALLACQTETPQQDDNSAQPVEYTDNEYDYAFQFPADWKRMPPPETGPDGEVRVVVQGPQGGTAMVTVGQLGTAVTADVFKRSLTREAAVQGWIDLTIEQVYKKASRDIGASDIMVLERRSVPSDAGIMYYINTVLTVEGQPIVMTGLHVTPFGKAHQLSFVMTTPLVPKGTELIETYTRVFDSFYLLGEKPTTR